MEEKKTERLKLTITRVEPTQIIAGKDGKADFPKFSFAAKTEGGKELSYFTFSRSLFPLIEVDKVIEADVQISTRESGGNIYTDRQVKQIYQEGQPVAQKRQWSGGRSPQERASIEAQVAVKAITELEIAGKTIALGLVELRNTWLRQALGTVLGSQPLLQGEGEKPLPSPAKSEIIDPPIKNLGDLFTRCSKPPYSLKRNDVLEKIGVKDMLEIADPQAAWDLIKDKKAEGKI